MNFRRIERGHDGRSKGFGLVEFKYYQDAKKAIEELNGVLLDGREVYVRYDKEPEAQDKGSGRGRSGQRPRNDDYKRGDKNDRDEYRARRTQHGDRERVNSRGRRNQYNK